MRKTDRQLYLRVEPTAEGRELLVQHRRKMHDVLHHLHLTPRLSDIGDLHRTELFLDSSDRWRRAFRAVGAAVALSENDLLDFIDLPPEERTILPSVPWQYEPFFTGGAAAVFVLRLTNESARLTTRFVQHLEHELRAWEADGGIPQDTVAQLVRDVTYPLARYHQNPKPHITLARGRVSPKRQRDVARSLRATALADVSVIPSATITIRAVRSSKILGVFAPIDR